MNVVEEGSGEGKNVGERVDGAKVGFAKVGLNEGRGRCVGKGLETAVGDIDGASLEGAKLLGAQDVVEEGVGDAVGEGEGRAEVGAVVPVGRRKEGKTVGV